MAACLNVDAEKDYGQLPIHKAAVKGDIETIKKLLARKASVDSVTLDGSTALHVAAQYGQLDTVKFLVEQGSNVNQVNNWGDTALHLASQDGFVEVAEALIGLNANVNAENNNSKTALFLAVDEGDVAIIKLLLKHKASINHRDCEGNCPLHRCLECLSDKEGMKIAMVLIENGADLNTCNNQNKSPLHVARSIEFSFELCTRLSKSRKSKEKGENKATQTSTGSSEEEKDSDIIDRVTDLEYTMTSFEQAMSSMREDILSLNENAANSGNDREMMKSDIADAQQRLSAMQDQILNTNGLVGEVVEQLALKHRTKQAKAAAIDMNIWKAVFRMISKGAAIEWKNIFRTLTEDCVADVLIIENKIEEIKHKNASRIQDQAYDSLVTALSLCGMTFTPELLVRALRACDQNLIADQIEKLHLL